MIGKIINSQYKVIEKVGSGGTSLVYKAERLSDKKLVAIKVLREEYADNDEQVERFLQESHALSHLSHRNIVNVFDIGQIDNTYFIVMEYVHGETLKDIIKSNGIIAYNDAIEIILQVCAALGNAHDNDIIHRDIKPQNILVSTDGNVKIADFGLARILTQNTLTMNNKDVIGTVHYISPEQVRGTHIDARSDIYSLGIVLYEMVTGKLPFSGGEAVTIAMKHINQMPKRPISINPEIPKCLDEIIMRCLAKEPSHRYQKISDLEIDLIGAITDPKGFVVEKPQKERPIPSQTVSNIENDIDDILIDQNIINTNKNNSTSTNKKITKLIAIILGAILILTLGIYALVSVVTNKTSAANYVVDNVVGISFNDASTKIINAGLRVVQAQEIVYSKDIPAGFVAKQNIVAGTKLKPYDTVILTLSAGPKKVSMPNLNKLQLDAAIKALNELGLVVGNVTNQDNNDQPANSVISQSVAPFTEVAEGTAINVTVAVSSKKDMVSVPNLLNQQKDQALKMIASSGFISGGVEEKEDATAAAGTVLSQTPQAGTQYTKSDAASTQIKITIAKAPNKQYTGTITIDMPVNSIVGSEITINYVKDSGEEVLYGNFIIDENKSPLTLSDTSNTQTDRIFRVYYNNVLYNIYSMKFT